MCLVQLQQCFRCGDRIIDASNRLIANGPEKVAPLIGATGRTGYVSVMHGRSEDIARAVQEQFEHHGREPQDVAVLARSHRELKRLASVFREQDIPCHHVGAGFDICDTDEWRWTYAALRLVVNPKDELAFWCVCDALGVDKADRAAIRAYSLDRGKPLLDSAMFYLTGNASRCFEMLSIAQDDDPDVTFETVGRVYDEAVTPYFPVIPEHVDTFWTRRYWSQPVASAIHQVAMRDQTDDMPDHRFGPRVTLSTVHAAKGLEWPVVIVANCNEKSFPSSQAVREDKIDEERRLMYVAMTRARDALVLHYRRFEDQNAERGVQRPSRFLNEAVVM